MYENKIRFKISNKENTNREINTGQKNLTEDNKTR